MLSSGVNLADSAWHTVYVRRRANKLQMWVDDQPKSESMYTMILSHFDNNKFEKECVVKNSKDSEILMHLLFYLVKKHKAFIWAMFLHTHKSVVVYI